MLFRSVKAGYEAGAKNCIVRWEDDKLSRLHYEYAKEEDLVAMKPYELRSYCLLYTSPGGRHSGTCRTSYPNRAAGTPSFLIILYSFLFATLLVIDCTDQRADRCV